MINSNSFFYHEKHERHEKFIVGVDALIDPWDDVGIIPYIGRPKVAPTYYYFVFFVCFVVDLLKYYHLIVKFATQK